MKVALLQLNASDNPAENLPVTRDLVEEAASAGARFILTPEVTNCVSTSRSHQKVVLQSEAEDITLSRLRQDAERLGVWVLIGSLALVPDHGERFVNRSFLIGPDGGIRARYDKIHMFDVDVSEKETYHESDGFRPGDEAVLTHVDDVPVGLTICYDVRFPYLYRGLSKGPTNLHPFDLQKLEVVMSLSLYSAKRLPKNEGFVKLYIVIEFKLAVRSTEVTFQAPRSVKTVGHVAVDRG